MANTRGTKNKDGGKRPRAAMTAREPDKTEGDLEETVAERKGQDQVEKRMF